MALKMIPYGLLESGELNVLIDDATGFPETAVVEVFASLPAVASADNFDGRLVFDLSTQVLYVFVGTGTASPEWFPLEGIPATIGTCTDFSDPAQPKPPAVPVPVAGELFYCTDTEVAFVWDGVQWVPIGGRFAAQYFEVTHTGDSLTTLFSLGVGISSTPGSTNEVEVFYDGIRQVGGIDYQLVGLSIDTTIGGAPGTGVIILIRTTISQAVVQNVQTVDATYPSVAGGLSTFDAGAAGLDPSGIFVYKDGLLLAGGGVDYVHSSADTSILSITDLGTNTARAVTTVTHNAAPGNIVDVQGIDTATAGQNEFSGSKTITATPSATEFEYAVVSATADAFAIPDPILFWTPAFVNDNIILNVPTSGGEDIVIRSIKSAVTAPTSGEANTASNLGGGFGVFSTKSGVDLRFKSFTEGPGITIVDLGTELQVTADSGILFEARQGINTSTHTLGSDESYIGVRNTSFSVTIDVSSVPGGTSGSGRRVTIKDESGGATINNINIVHAGRTFDGAATPLVINTNFGSVTIVFDGTNWFLV